MYFRKGDRVKHPNWGIGEILEDSTGNNVHIFFVKVGEKKFYSRSLSEKAFSLSFRPKGEI